MNDIVLRIALLYFAFLYSFTYFFNIFSQSFDVEKYNGLV